MQKLRTGRHSYRFINRDRVISAVFNFTVAVLATYGAMDLLLKANGI